MKTKYRLPKHRKYANVDYLSTKAHNVEYQTVGNEVE